MAKSVERKRTYNAGLRQEQAQMTKDRILDAASRLFVKSGYSSVTVEDIALEAGVAHQTVYAVFRTKLALAQTIIWSSFQTEGINELMAQALESGEPEVRIQNRSDVLEHEFLVALKAVPIVINETTPKLLAILPPPQWGGRLGGESTNVFCLLIKFFLIDEVSHTGAALNQLCAFLDCSFQGGEDLSIYFFDNMPPLHVIKAICFKANV